VTHSKTALSNMPMTNLVEDDLVELLYQGKAGKLTVPGELLDIYNDGCKKLGQESVFTVADLPATPEEAIKHWNLPAEYIELDLDVYFANKINTIEEAIRVSEELALFRERGLEPMLRFMIYLVKVMKDNNIIWGVGRGSSVSSFLLFLVGLHQINPIKYNLDIKEFIR
jgi:DNA polymerase III alpha subunit